MNGGRTWWAHFEFTRTNIEPTILRKKIEDQVIVGASSEHVVDSALLSGGTRSNWVAGRLCDALGITARDSIMMIYYFEHLVGFEVETLGLHAVIRGASERLIPVLMTAIVTALGLLPLAMGSGQPGKEIALPMAVVILGGLVTSTVLNLLVVPTLALRYGRFDAADADA